MSDIRFYACPAGHVAVTLIYPEDDRELCVRKPEHSECEVCHAVMTQLDGPRGKPLDPQPPRPHEPPAPAA